MPKLEVGKKYDWFGGDRNIGKEGAILESIEDDGGYILSIYLNNMKSKEKKLLKSDIIRVRYIKESNYIIFMLRFGVSPLILEVTFDPTLYKDNRAMQLLFDNHMFTFVGIESKTNIIQTLRMANVPIKLKRELVTTWNNAFKDPDYSDKYAIWTSNLYQHSTMELWEKGIDAGHFGENF